MSDETSDHAVKIEPEATGEPTPIDVATPETPEVETPETPEAAPGTPVEAPAETAEPTEEVAG